MAPYPAGAGAEATVAVAHRAVREHHTDDTDTEFKFNKPWNSALIQIESDQSVVKSALAPQISRLLCRATGPDNRPGAGRWTTCHP